MPPQRSWLALGSHAAIEPRPLHGPATGHPNKLNIPGHGMGDQHPPYRRPAGHLLDSSQLLRTHCRTRSSPRWNREAENSVFRSQIQANPPPHKGTHTLPLEPLAVNASPGMLPFKSATRHCIRERRHEQMKHPDYLNNRRAPNRPPPALNQPEALRVLWDMVGSR